MANVVVNDTYLSDIADAIRAKNGSSDTYKPSEMADAISAISGGGITPTGTINITENGTVDVTQYASASVNVPTSASDWVDVTPNLSSVTITNGTGTAHSYDSSTDALRVYSTANGTYRSASIDFTPESGVKYRIEYTLENANTAATNLAVVNSSDSVIIGLSRANSAFYAYETVLSTQPNYTSPCKIRFYCTWSTSAAGDATFKNFRVYKYVGGNA